ncbi:unnamed protein product, partial [Didymodactylos carnosus]
MIFRDKSKLVKPNQKSSDQINSQTVQAYLVQEGVSSILQNLLLAHVIYQVYHKPSSENPTSLSFNDTRNLLSALSFGQGTEGFGNVARDDLEILMKQLDNWSQNHLKETTTGRLSLPELAFLFAVDGSTVEDDEMKGLIIDKLRSNFNDSILSKQEFVQMYEKDPGIGEMNNELQHSLENLYDALQGQFRAWNFNIFRRLVFRFSEIKQSEQKSKWFRNNKNN